MTISGVETADGLEAALTAKFEASYAYYARKCLKIRKKNADTGFLEFNRCQRAVDEKCEDQLRRTGRVRLVVLKCRQPGISTYFTGRSYYKTTFNNGYRAFVLTQMDDTTDALFGMIKRFHENVPDFVRPVTGASNAKELVFSRMDSGYRVSTAGNKTTGRGGTVQIFHGSEVSRWPNAEEHVAGVLESVPNMPGTEIWLESTANGIGNLFHKMWKAAERGEPPYECLFLPWYWHEEYEMEPQEPDWVPFKQLAEYADLHGLSEEQTYWAYRKNLELSRATGGRSDEICWLFRQEYPATAQEAFQTSGVNSFITGELVTRARRNGSVSGYGPIILGVDVARGGDDKTALIDRQGRRLGAHVCKKVDYGKDVMPLVGEIVRTVKEMRAQDMPLKKIVVDATGVGGGVYDRLREQLGEELVAGVEFGGRALQKDRYSNRRAEIWDTMRQWFMSDATVGIPDNEDLQGDLCAPAWGDGQMTRFRSDGSLILEDKSHMKKRLKFSPDFGDAAALTFAISYDEFVNLNQNWSPPAVGPGAWML